MTIIREQTKELSGEKFLLTQEEFSTVEVQYNKTIQRTKAALGPSFIEENVNFSGTDIDPNYLIKVFTECVAMLSTEKLRH